MTNRPTLVNRCCPIPGISDHDIVLIDLHIRATRQQNIKRKIFIWKRANIEEITYALQEFSDDFVSMHHVTTPVQQLWDILSNKFLEMMDKQISTKMTSSRHNQLWINGTIKNLLRRKHGAFNRARHTESECDWRYYRKLKKAARLECKRAYRTYLNDIYNEDQNNKKFWAFLTSKRCDSSGVAPLRRNDTTSNDSKAQANILND